MIGAIGRGIGAAVGRLPGAIANPLRFGAGATLGLGTSRAATAGRLSAGAVDAGRSVSGGRGASVMGFQLGGGGVNKIGEALNLRVAQSISKLAKLDAPGVIDALSYGAFLGSKFVPEDHPKLHAALDAAGLLGLAGTTAYGIYKDPKHEFKPGAKDLAGLALMGSALYDRTKSHG